MIGKLVLCTMITLSNTGMSPIKSLPESAIQGFQLQPLGWHGDIVLFTPNSRMLLASPEGIFYYDLKTGNYGKWWGGASVTALGISPDSSKIAAAVCDKDGANNIKVLDIQNREPLSTLVGHADVILAVCFSPDGKYIASSGWNGHIILWNIKDGTKRDFKDYYRLHIHNLCFSPNSSLLLVGGENILAVYSLLNDDSLITIRDTSFYDSTVYSLHVMDANFINDSLIVFDDGTVAIVAKITPKFEILHRIRYSHNLTKIDVSPHENIIAIGTENGKVLLWAWKEGKIVKSLGGHKEAVAGVEFDPSGKFLVSYGHDGSVYVWKVGD